MTIKMLMAVASGGALGAVLRYSVTSFVGQWAGHGFPWGTLTVNIVGSFVLGALIEIMALQWSPCEAVRAFIVVGVLGAFTTFSTFSLDIQTLIARDQMMLAVVYVGGSVSIGFAALMAGMMLFRQVLS